MTTGAGDDGGGGWELVDGAPHARLRTYLRGGYVGYRQALAVPQRQLQMPHGGVVLIVNLGAPVDVDGAAHRSFVAGLYDAPVVVADDGRQAGIQANLTPLGARALLGLPLRELTGRTVALADVLATGRSPAPACRAISADELAGGERLAERLAELPGWPARFAALDRFLLRRLSDAPPPRADVAYAWSRLEAARGGVAIATLCRELGCSSRHLSARFGEEIGMTPKAFARVLRFERAAALLARGVAPAQVAATCGYADQPHLTREFRAFARRTPAVYATSVTNVQDVPGVAA